MNTKKIEYKLVKIYPNSPELGTIHWYDSGLKSSNEWLGVDFYEKYSEYWKLIEEKPDFEIVNFIKKGSIHTSTPIFNNELLDTYLKEGYKINSIKRLSDDKVLAVGDLISKINSPNEKLIIENLVLENDDVIVSCTDESEFLIFDLKLKDVVEYIEPNKQQIILGFRSKEFKNTIYKLKDGLYHNNDLGIFNLDSMLHKGACVDNGVFEIFEVKNSIDEIFTIGDRVIFTGLNKSNYETAGFEIDNFYLRDDGMVICRSKDNLKVEDIETVKKFELKKQPLFVTEGGVEVFEGDSYWFVVENVLNPNAWKPLQDLVNWDNQTKPPLGKVQFSTEEKAIEYIKSKKQPLFTTEDGVEVFERDEFYYVGDANNICLSKYLYKCLYKGDGDFSKFKTFSAQKAATEYIINFEISELLESYYKKCDELTILRSETGKLNNKIFTLQHKLKSL